MKKNFNIILSLSLTVLFMACQEEDDFGIFLRPNLAEIPVDYPNATTFGGIPFIEVSISGSGEIEFVMEIPQNSGRSIAQLSTVAAGTTSVNAGTLTRENYLDEPVLGTNNLVTFSTTLTEFADRRPTVPIEAERNLGFMFEIVLDDGSVIIPREVEVRLTE